MNRRAFTLIETLAVLLVVSLGLTAAIGMFTYALRQSIEAQARSTAMATAMSVAVDPLPLLDPDLVGDWQVTTYDFDTNNPTAGTSLGLINGYLVQRRESTVQADIIASVTLPMARVMARSVQIDVDVYDAAGKYVLASYTTRFVRQREEAVP